MTTTMKISDRRRRKIVCAYADMLCATEQFTTPDIQWYEHAKHWMEGFARHYDSMEEARESVLFFISWEFGKNYQKKGDKVPTIHINESQLPINYTVKERKDITLAIQIIIDVFDESREKYGLDFELAMDDFDEFFNRTSEFMLPIPLVFLNT